MLSEVTSYQEFNKMTSENLAVCFAPTLLCGSDQMEDVKISNILRKVIRKATDEWPRLREIFGIDEGAFKEALKAPDSPDDYEDPLDTSDVKPAPAMTVKIQTSGIVMEDNDPSSDTEQSEGIASPQSPVPPPLPPRELPDVKSWPPSLPPRSFTNPTPPVRPPTSDPSTSSKDEDVIVKRKPAPPLALPPRYSMVFNDLSHSPSSHVATDGFGSPRRSGWSVNESDAGDSPTTPGSAGGSPVLGSGTFVKRKPVGFKDDKVDENVKQEDTLPTEHEK
jgi:Rho GTPase-activating protein 1